MCCFHRPSMIVLKTIGVLVILLLSSTQTVTAAKSTSFSSFARLYETRFNVGASRSRSSGGNDGKKNTCSESLRAVHDTPGLSCCKSIPPTPTPDPPRRPENVDICRGKLDWSVGWGGLGYPLSSRLWGISSASSQKKHSLHGSVTSFGK